MGQMIGGIIIILAAIYIIQLAISIFIWILPVLKWVALLAALGTTAIGLKMQPRRFRIFSVSGTLLVLTVWSFWLDMDEPSFNIGGICFPCTAEDIKTGSYSCKKQNLTDSICTSDKPGEFFGVQYKSISLNLTSGRHSSTILAFDKSTILPSRKENFSQVQEELVRADWKGENTYTTSAYATASYDLKDLRYCEGPAGKTNICPSYKFSTSVDIKNIAYQNKTIPASIVLTPPKHSSSENFEILIKSAPLPTQ